MKAKEFFEAQAWEPFHATKFPVGSLSQLKDMIEAFKRLLRTENVIASISGPLTFPPGTNPELMEAIEQYFEDDPWTDPDWEEWDDDKPNALVVKSIGTKWVTVSVENLDHGPPWEESEESRGFPKTIKVGIPPAKEPENMVQVCFSIFDGSGPYNDPPPIALMRDSFYDQQPLEEFPFWVDSTGNMVQAMADLELLLGYRPEFRIGSALMVDPKLPPEQIALVNESLKDPGGDPEIEVLSVGKVWAGFKHLSGGFSFQGFPSTNSPTYLSLKL